MQARRLFAVALVVGILGASRAGAQVPPWTGFATGYPTADVAAKLRDDATLQRDLGPMPRTPLREGIRQTLGHFRRLQAEGRLDTADLEA